jgi:hypothetical protein
MGTFVHPVIDYYRLQIVANKLPIAVPIATYFQLAITNFSGKQTEVCRLPLVLLIPTVSK